MAQPDLPRQGTARLVLPRQGMVPARQRMVHREVVKQGMAQLVLPRPDMAQALGLQPGQGMAQLDLPRQGMGQQALQRQGMAQPLLRRQAMAQPLLPKPLMEPSQRLLQHLPMELPPMLLPLRMGPATLAVPHQEDMHQGTAPKQQQHPLLPPVGMGHRGHTPKPAQDTVGVVAMVKQGRHRAVMEGSLMQRPLVVLLLQPSLQHMVQVRAPHLARAAMVAPHNRYQTRLCPCSVLRLCLWSYLYSFVLLAFWSCVVFGTRNGTGSDPGRLTAVLVSS